MPDTPNKFWMVINATVSGPGPTTFYGSEKAAQLETTRLAMGKPGQGFAVLEAMSFVTTEAPSVSIVPIQHAVTCSYQ